MRRMVGESSTTKMLFILSSSDTSEETLQITDWPDPGEAHRQIKRRYLTRGTLIVRETAKIAKTDVYETYFRSFGNKNRAAGVFRVAVYLTRRYL
jgi:hypothetical protein